MQTLTAQTETEIQTPCPYCGREDEGKWFTPCPEASCPSHAPNADDLPIPHCIIAVSPNSWGRGPTVEEALRQCVKAGGQRKGAQLRMIVGDAKPYINDLGSLIMDRSAKLFKI